MLSTRSFIARVRIACRSQQVAFPLLPNLGTVEDVETFYNQLMEQQSRPDPYLLQAKRGLLDSAYENMNVCQGEVINYGRKLPTDDEERDIAVRAKARIEEIDKALASPK
jgi:hypothetical protein